MELAVNTFSNASVCAGGESRVDRHGLIDTADDRAMDLQRAWSTLRIFYTENLHCGFTLVISTEDLLEGIDWEDRLSKHTSRWTAFHRHQITFSAAGRIQSISEFALFDQQEWKFTAAHRCSSLFTVALFILFIRASRRSFERELSSPQQDEMVALINCTPTDHNNP